MHIQGVPTTVFNRSLAHDRVCCALYYQDLQLLLKELSHSSDTESRKQYSLQCKGNTPHTLLLLCSLT